MQQRAMSSISKALAAVVIFSSASALAGEQLFLKSGVVETEVAARESDTSRALSGKHFYVVQFKGTIRPQDLQNLQTLGAKAVRYIPDDALVVKASARVAQTVPRSSTDVHAVVPFMPEWKLSPELEPASVYSRNSRGQVFVQMFPGEDSTTILDRVRALPGAKLVSTSDRAFIAEVSLKQVASLATLPGVEWVEPAPQVEPLVLRGLTEASDARSLAGDYSDLTGYESGTKLINASTAYGRGFTGRGQIASAADTGHDSGDLATMHQDFRGRVPTGFIFGLFAKSWNDPMGHGTHVAGSIMGNGAASGGKLRGVAYDASLIPEGMWSPMMDNLTVPAKLGDLFSKAYKEGARIHSNSWGKPSDFGTYDGMASQVDEYMAANPDMLILFAAGNSGIDKNRDGRIDENSIGSPGTAKNILTVGASKNYVLNGGMQVKLSETRLKENWPVEPLASSRMSETSQGLAAFSSRGPTLDGRLKPEVVAPGTNILSVYSQVPGAQVMWGAYNKDYVWAGGTSMATPITAGAATVVRQYLIDSRKIAQPSAALMKAVLMHTATEMFPGGFGEIGANRGQEILTLRPNNDEGYGRVDLDQATNLEKAILVDEKGGLATGEAHTYPVRVGTSARLTATLVYTDSAASAAAAKALVNDLDVVLVGPDGQEKSLNDRTNNSEMLQASVKSGDYQVRVKGTAVPQGPAKGKQPYALVLSLN